MARLARIVQYFVLINFLILVVWLVSLNVSQAIAPDWFSTQTPQMTQVVALPKNTLPDAINLPCAQISYVSGNTSAKDCVGPTTVGILSAEGQGLYTDDQTAVPVLLNGGSSTSFLPTPGAAKVLVVNYATGNIWNYVGFYDALRRADLSDKQVSTGFLKFQRQFWVSRGADYFLKDESGNKLLLNTQAMAFSPNGRWLVVDSSTAWLRIDLEDPTRPILRFAPTLESSWSHGLANAQVAVTDDGRYVGVSVRAGFGWPDTNLTIYDVSGCTSPTTFAGCKSRDMWAGEQGLGKTFVTPAKPSNLRFIDNYNLSFNEVFNQLGNNYDAATFVVTAPGGSLHGLGLLGMGDSYISGEGAFVYAKGTDTAINHCHESLASYPFLLSSQWFANGDSVACSGAVIGDITNGNSTYKGQNKDQLTQGSINQTAILDVFTPGYLNQNKFVNTYRPEAILLSIGGNDMGFGSMVKNCVAHFRAADPFSSVGFENTCYAAYEDRYEFMQQVNRTFNTLVQTYQAIKAASPASRIYVVGYPQIVKAYGQCALNVRLDGYETQFAVDAINYINDAVHRAADKAGVFYIDTTDAFDGHKLCDETADAVNGLSSGDDELGIIGHESYHPTVLGHRLLAQAIDNATHHLTAALPTAQPSLTAPTITGTEALLQNAPLGRTNRAMYVVVPTTDVVPSQVRPGQNISLSISGLLSNFAPNMTVNVYVHSSTQVVGTLQTDANGDIPNVTITVPQGVSAGYQNVDVYGKDFGGNAVDVQQSVYVTASADDYDGDGIVNAQDECPYLANSGVDHDQDGIDDVCDPAITDPLVVPGPTEESAVSQPPDNQQSDPDPGEQPPTDSGDTTLPPADNSSTNEDNTDSGEPNDSQDSSTVQGTENPQEPIDGSPPGITIDPPSDMPGSQAPPESSSPGSPDSSLPSSITGSEGTMQASSSIPIVAELAHTIDSDSQPALSITPIQGTSTNQYVQASTVIKTPNTIALSTTAVLGAATRQLTQAVSKATIGTPYLSLGVVRQWYPAVLISVGVLVTVPAPYLLIARRRAKRYS